MSNSSSYSKTIEEVYDDLTAMSNLSSSSDVSPEVRDALREKIATVRKWIDRTSSKAVLRGFLERVGDSLEGIEREEIVRNQGQGRMEQTLARIEVVVLAAIEADQKRKEARVPAVVWAIPFRGSSLVVTYHTLFGLICLIIALAAAGLDFNEIYHDVRYGHEHKEAFAPIPGEGTPHG